MVCKNTIKQNKMVKMLFFNYDKKVQKMTFIVFVLSFSYICFFCVYS